MYMSGRRYSNGTLYWIAAIACFGRWLLSAQGESWPAESTPVEIGAAAGGLPGTQEVSGAVWNPALQRLFVVDDNSGRITAMDANGNNKVSWEVGCNGDCDHEAVTFADWYSQQIFVGVEQSPLGANNRKVRMYDLGGTSQAVLLQSWTLPEMGGTTPANSGLEGLTFVPDAFLVKFPDTNGVPYNAGKGSRFGSGGLFFAGLQNDGAIYVYDHDIKGPTTNRVFVRKFTPVPGRADLSDLSFDRQSGLLYVLWDSANLLAARVLPTVAEPNGHALHEWPLWNGDSLHGGAASARSDEGVAIANDCSSAGAARLFMTDDTGEFIWRFDQWPCYLASASDTVLVPQGSIWRYRDDGNDQPPTWITLAFNDSSWASGPAELGYGDGGEATVINCGPSAPACTNNFITTYFRRTFYLTNAPAFTALKLRLLRDDGAVVYINGTEVLRDNMPAGTISNQIQAVTAIAGIDETTYFEFTIDASALVAGANVLAVELHQALPSSSDVSFDLELIGSAILPVTRGPYLQSATPTSLVVRWRTASATDSRVRFGLDSSALTSFTDNPAITTEHEVQLTGLSPDTRYYYSIGSTSNVLAGPDSDHFFFTPPVVGTPQPTRVWVIGDSGTADANAAAVRDAYLGFAGGAYADLWLMLGDNAYFYGTDDEYQHAVFDMYPTLLQQSVVWPTLGNHDTASSYTPPDTLPYFSIFTLPTNGAAGGMASGTEKYYSFDYANIHFICLDSMASDRSSNGVMGTWLQTDLNSTTQQWIIAFWHHPPYSKGSHDSDNNLSDFELVQMRQNLLPMLEAGGVDLVLCGHSHSYERSFLLDGHYDFSNTLTPAMILDGGNGRVDGTGAYLKASDASHDGAVYVVAGSSGQLGGGALNHPAMFLSLNMLGSLVLDVAGDRLDATFIDNASVVQDYFTLSKATLKADFTATPTNGAAPLSVSFADISTGPITNRYWDFGNGATLNTTATVVGNVYNTEGTYTVSLTVDGAMGSNTTTRVNYIQVTSNAPKPTVTIVATDAAAAEPGTNKGTIKIVRTGSTAASLTVHYNVSGTASNGVDYTTLSGTRVIPAGTNSTKISVTPLDDALVEAAETVTLTLAPSAAYNIGSPNNATVTITDDDGALPAVSIAATDAIAAEPGSNTGKFTVTRTGPTNGLLKIFYTVGGSAAAGTDYTALNGQVTIQAGKFSRAIAVKPIDDAITEAAETVILTLRGTNTYTIGSPASATVTINDND